MILRAMGLGFLLWLAQAGVLRFIGANFFTPNWAASILAFAITAVLGALIAFAALKALREAHGDEAEAAIGLAFPGMALSAVAINYFTTIFPALDPALDGVYGAHMLLMNGAFVFTGLFFTRLAPQDERL